MAAYDIAVLPGDGIAPEVVAEAQRVLDAAGGPELKYTEHPCGAGCYLDQGDPLPESTVEACRRADAVLLGAMGLPDVRWPDGTEMRPQIDLRILLDLYAGVRPIYLYAAHHCPLKGYGAGDIDFVILRENVEGLFASMNGGLVLREETAVDTMVITRSGSERISRNAFGLALQRRAERLEGERGDRAACVTLVDKANVFRSMAFFRQVFDEVAAGFRAEAQASPEHGDTLEEATRTVVWERPRRTRILDRRAVGSAGVEGPAILTQLDTTTLVPPGWRAQPDREASGNLILRETGGGRR